MKIRTRITLLFTLITGSLLLAFAGIVYYSAKENREKEFYSLLKKEAITKANLFLDAEVDTQTLQNIYKSNRQILNEVEVAIYNTQFELLYHDAVEIDFVKESAAMIDEIYQKNEIRFYQERWQVLGLRYEYNNENYIITAAAFDEYGYAKLANLLRSIVFVFIISILFIYMAGRFFSQKVFDPIKEMTDKARKISATNLDLRLSGTDSQDELSELSNTFNEMLNRLENSFDAQKHFVSNISHEIRTPLSAIIAELELSLNKNRQTDEYKLAIENALNDAKKLVRLSNSLLDLAKASYDPTEIVFKAVRIDEILMDACQMIQQANPGYTIHIDFDSKFMDEEVENLMQIEGNEYLLKIAFANLMENGCKFSDDKQSRVSISVDDDKIQLLFTDKGTGISQEDIPHIFTPFYRGQNKVFVDGNGIGLSLTQKIIHLHKGYITLSSELKKGTQFRVLLPQNNF
jgi:two-component system sensor histidine kinase ArlS